MKVQKQNALWSIKVIIISFCKYFYYLVFILLTCSNILYFVELNLLRFTSKFQNILGGVEHLSRGRLAMNDISPSSESAIEQIFNLGTYTVQVVESFH